MSLKVMSWAWTVRLPPAPKLVLMALADEANDEGYCFPSHRHLAYKCNVSERNVRRVLSTLISNGHLAVEQRFKKDRSRTSNGYRVGSHTPRSNCPGGLVSSDRGDRTAVTGGPGHGCPGPPDTGVLVTTTEPYLYPKDLEPPEPQGEPLAPTEDGVWW